MMTIKKIQYCTVVLASYDKKNILSQQQHIIHLSLLLLAVETLVIMGPAAMPKGKNVAANVGLQSAPSSLFAFFTSSPENGRFFYLFHFFFPLPLSAETVLFSLRCFNIQPTQRAARKERKQQSTTSSRRVS